MVDSRCVSTHSLKLGGALSTQPGGRRNSDTPSSWEISDREILYVCVCVCSMYVCVQYVGGWMCVCCRACLTNLHKVLL